MEHGHDHGYRHSAVQVKNGTAQDLRKALLSIDHRGYPAYKDLTGHWTFPGYVLNIEHVQGDPFAAPSSLSAEIKNPGFPAYAWKKKECRTALEDHLIRKFHEAVENYSKKAKGSGKSGLISCSRPGQEIIERSACHIDKDSGSLIFRFSVGFPAAGRTVLAGELEKILFTFLPDCIRKSLFFSAFPEEEIRSVTDLAEDQMYIREQLRERDLAAFIADGSILPRESGISEKPMRGAVVFRSPIEDRIELDLPHKGRISGMAVPAGITLIIGGGYHGKSTLMKALEKGVYNHIGGDGREYCITDDTAVKVRAEDGRWIWDDDISTFIHDLPGGKNTVHFNSENASGSTSQAASTSEAIEAGSGVLLMDEDTCATNFMVRDALMQRIVSDSEETITPYCALMRSLWKENHVSTIMAVGSSGAFFRSADLVIRMKEYVPADVTESVKKLLSEEEPGHDSTAVYTFKSVSDRHPGAHGDLAGEQDRTKCKTLGRDGFLIGHSEVDLRYVEQICDGEETMALARILVYLAPKMNGKNSLKSLVDSLSASMEKDGFAGFIRGRIPGDLAMPRKQEIYAALNRCRMISG